MGSRTASYTQYANIFNSYVSGAVKVAAEGEYSNVCTDPVMYVNGDDATNYSNVYYLSANSTETKELEGLTGVDTITADGLGIAFADQTDSAPVLHWQVDDPSTGVTVNYNAATSTPSRRPAA